MQNTQAPLTIGLTGGIASGKSTVAHFFSELGIEVISADVIARDILTKNSPALVEVVQAFGIDILNAKQELDRAKLRSLIFNNETARRQLDAITHPAIGKVLLDGARSATSDYVVLEIPLLVEAKMTTVVDRVLVVDIEPEVQIERVMLRDDSLREEAKSAIAAQVSSKQRLQHADDVIRNHGSVEKLHQQVALLHRLYSKLAKQRSVRESIADSGTYNGLDLH